MDTQIIRTNALTGVRAIAAYMVFFHHYPLVSSTVGVTLNKLFLDFHIGVEVFFVLSGFLIGYNYYGKISMERESILGFYKNRFARIYPLYCILMIVTYLSLHVTDFSDWFRQLTLFKGFYGDLKFTGIAQAWSLTVEMVFYIIAPFLLVYLKKTNKNKMFYVLIGTYLVGVILVIIGKLIGNGLFDTFQFMLLYTFFGRCLEFYIGVYLAIMVKNNDITFRRINKIKFKTYLGLICFVALLFAMNSFVSPQYSVGVFHPVGILINNLLIPVATALFLLGLITENTIISKLLSTQMFQILGKSSYAFYLIHIGVIANVLHVYGVNTKPTLFISFIIISIILYYLVEEPYRKLINSHKRQKSELVHSQTIAQQARAQ